MGEYDARLDAFYMDQRSGQKEIMNMSQVGGLDGYVGEYKFGKYGDLDNGETSDIWTPGGTMHYFGTAENMRWKSSSVTDVGTVKMFGLDNSFSRETENIVLDGTNWVESTGTYLRVWRAGNISDGGDQGTGFVGSVSCVSGTGTHLQAEIPIDAGQTLMSQFTVPAEKTLYLTQWHVSSDKTGGGNGAIIEYDFKVREPNTTFQSKDHLGIGNKVQNQAFKNLNPYLRVPEKSDIKVTASGTGASDNDVHVTYHFYLKDN